jgi:hypothetical protein
MPEQTPPASKPERKSATDVQAPVPKPTDRATKAKIAAGISDEKFAKAMAGTPATTEEGQPLTKKHKVVRMVAKSTPEPAPAKEAKETSPKSGQEQEKVEKKPDPSPAAAVPNAADSAPAAADAAEKKPEETTTLPAEVRRSLQNYGYTDAQIDEKLKTGSKDFLNIAEMAHNIRKKEVEAYARLGQQVQQQKPAAPQTTVAAPAATDEVTEADIQEFLKLNPNNPSALFIAKQARSDIAFRQQQREATRAAQNAATQTQINSFFAQEGMKAYTEHYAKPEVRQKLLETAAAVEAGLAAQGRQVTVTEALTMAHDALAAPIVKAAARQEITDEAKARDAALTQRNVGGGNPAPETPSRKSKHFVTRIA